MSWMLMKSRFWVPTPWNGEGRNGDGLLGEDVVDAVVGLRGLSRAVDVKMPEVDRVDVVKVVIEPAVVVDGEHIEAVGRECGSRRRLSLWGARCGGLGRLR